ncbi:MAG: ABC transporter substrate-binding protein [Candidatus Competibacterales bacterium]
MHALRQGRLHYGWRRLVLLTPSVGGSAYRERWARRLSYEGFEVVMSRDLVSAAKATQLELLARRTPDALVIASPDASPSAVGAAADFVRQLRRQGIAEEVPLVGGAVLDRLTGVSEAAVNGAVYGLPWDSASPNPTSQAYVAAHRQTYGVEPPAMGVAIYTAARALSRALELTASTDPDILYRTLVSLEALPSPLGPFRYTNAGVPQHPPVVLVKSGPVRLPLRPLALEARPVDVPVRVGAPLALTGPMAPYGAACRRGIELAVSDVVERGLLAPGGLEILWWDTEGRPSKAVEALGHFEDQRAVAVIGPSTAAAVRAVYPEIQRRLWPLLTSATGPADLALGEGVFRLAPADEVLIDAVVAVASEALGLGRAVVVHTGEGHTHRGATHFRHALEAAGVAVAAVETVDTSSAPTAMASRPGGGPLAGGDIDVVAVSAELATAAAVAEAIAAGSSFEGVILGDATLGTALAQGSALAAGAIVPSPWRVDSPWPASRRFVAAHGAAFAKLPTPRAAQCYTALWVLAAALSQADRDALVARLQNPGFVDSPLGLFGFDKGGNPRYYRGAEGDTAVHMVHNNGLMLLK